MAVPSSGALRLASIRNEIENNVYEVTYTASPTGLGAALLEQYGDLNFNSKISTGSVTSSAATNVSNNQFTMNGNISSYGGLYVNIAAPHKMSEFYDYDHDATAPVKGFVYSSSNSTPTIGGSGVTNRTVSGTSTGNFSYNQFTGILSSTTYYYRAYVTNRKGTVYGSVISLTTSSGTSLSSYTLKYSSSKFAESSICSSSNTVTVYSSESSSNAVFTNASTIYANSSGGTEASSGWYSNGTYKAKWSSFGSGGSWTISYSSCIN